MSVLSLAEQDVEVEVEQVPHVVVLPRVNLLPPEIAERRTFQRIKAGLGGAVVVAVGLVALLYVGATAAVNEAEGDLQAATATGAQLQAQSAQYQDVTAVYARAAAAETMLTQAMGQEVRWSRFLNDLSLTVPDNVWVKSVSFTQAPDVAAAPAAPGAAPVAPSLGTATFTGVGFAHDDVAVWLESLAQQKGYADPYFSSSAESLLGTRKVVTFSSTTDLTPDALSRRYLAGG